ncbi:MAG TPA: hypothetical protein DCQ90_04675 [Erysipelotrichaceae bacterium]|nr:hypothetical protein [Erysipelotrichaceae bacterium]
MFTSEIGRLFQNVLVRRLFIVLLLGFGLFSVNIFYGIENQNYKNELEQQVSMNSIQNSYLRYQLEAYGSYREDVSKRIENNEAKLNLPIFTDVDIRTQLINENIALRKIQSKDVRILPGYAITELLNSSLFSVMVLLLSCLLVYALFFEDMIHQTIYLYRSTPQTLSKLYSSKIAVFISVVLVYSLLCTCMVLILAQWDGIDLRSPIQWLVDFRFSFHFFSIIVYILVVMFIQTGAALFIGCIVLLFVILTRNISLGYTLAFVILLVEFILNSFIAINDEFSVLKYINLFYYMFGSIDHVSWLMFASVRLDFLTATLIFMLVCGMILTLVSRHLYLRLSSNGFTHQKVKGYQIRSTKLVWHEFLRILFFNKAFIVILLVLAYSYNRYSSFSISKSLGQIDYEMIESRYYGELNTTGLDRITKDLDEAKSAYEFLESTNSGGQKELSQEEYDALDLKARPYPSLIRIRNKMIQLYSAGSRFFVNDDGYDYIMESKSYFSVILHFGLITIALSLFVAMNVHNEYQNKLMQLYLSTKNGNLKKIRINMWLYYGVTLIFTFIVYSLYIFKIQKGYTIFNQNLPLFALTSATTSSMSLMNYTVISITLHLFVYFSILRIVYVFSRRFDVAVVVVIMIGFAFVQIALFNFIPAFSILYLLTISFVNQIWVTLAWIMALIVLNVFIQAKVINSSH